MKCSKCGTELTEDMFMGKMCFNCGNPVEQSQKIYDIEQAEKKEAAESEKIRLRKEILEDQEDRSKNHMVTTGYDFSGYEIEEYFGLVSGEVLVGGLAWKQAFSMNEVSSSSIKETEYSEKIKNTKKAALMQMVQESTLLGANGIIGISYSFDRIFEGMGIYISVNGTAVKIRKIEK